MVGAARIRLERRRAGGIQVMAGRVHRAPCRLEPPGNRLAARRAPDGVGCGPAAGGSDAAGRVVRTARRRGRAVIGTATETGRALCREEVCENGSLWGVGE